MSYFHHLLALLSPPPWPDIEKHIDQLLKVFDPLSLLRVLVSEGDFEDLLRKHCISSKSFPASADFSSPSIFTRFLKTLASNSSLPSSLQTKVLLLHIRLKALYPLQKSLSWVNSQRIPLSEEGFDLLEQDLEKFFDLVRHPYLIKLRRKESSLWDPSLIKVLESHYGPNPQSYLFLHSLSCPSDGTDISKILLGSNQYIALSAPHAGNVEEVFTSLKTNKVKVLLTIFETQEGGADPELYLFKYWPAVLERKIQYNNLTIKLNYTQDIFVHGCRYEYLTVRYLEIENVGFDPWTSLVYQIHVRSWKDRNTVDLRVLKKLIELLEHYNLRHEGPIAVHCKQGIGRTGTVILAHHLRTKMSKSQGTSSDQTSVNLLEELLRYRLQRDAVQAIKQLRLVAEFLSSSISNESAEDSVINPPNFHSVSLLGPEEMSLVEEEVSWFVLELHKNEGRIWLKEDVGKKELLEFFKGLSLEGVRSWRSRLRMYRMKPLLTFLSILVSKNVSAVELLALGNFEKLVLAGEYDVLLKELFEQLSKDKSRWFHFEDCSQQLRGYLEQKEMSLSNLRESRRYMDCLMFIRNTFRYQRTKQKEDRAALEDLASDQELDIGVRNQKGAPLGSQEGLCKQDLMQVFEIENVNIEDYLKNAASAEETERWGPRSVDGQILRNFNRLLNVFFREVVQKEISQRIRNELAPRVRGLLELDWALQYGIAEIKTRADELEKQIKDFEKVLCKLGELPTARNSGRGRYIVMYEKLARMEELLSPQYVIKEMVFGEREGLCSEIRRLVKALYELGEYLREQLLMVLKERVALASRYPTKLKTTQTEEYCRIKIENALRGKYGYDGDGDTHVNIEAIEGVLGQQQRFWVAEEIYEELVWEIPELSLEKVRGEVQKILNQMRDEEIQKIQRSF